MRIGVRPEQRREVVSYLQHGDSEAGAECDEPGRADRVGGVLHRLAAGGRSGAAAEVRADQRLGVAEEFAVPADPQGADPHNQERTVQLHSGQQVQRVPGRGLHDGRQPGGVGARNQPQPADPGSHRRPRAQEPQDDQRRLRHLLRLPPQQVRPLQEVHRQARGPLLQGQPQGQISNVWS